MWVRTLSDKLVNLANAFTVEVQPVKRYRTERELKAEGLSERDQKQITTGFAVVICGTGTLFDGDSHSGAPEMIRVCQFDGLEGTPAAADAEALALKVVDEIETGITHGYLIVDFPVLKRDHAVPLTTYSEMNLNQLVPVAEQRHYMFFARP